MMKSNADPEFEGKAQVFHHLNIVQDNYGVSGRCNCGWSARKEGFARDDLTEAIRDAYVAHLPPRARKPGLRVDLFGDPQAFKLPRYEPVAITSWWESQGQFFMTTEHGETLPILWIRLQDGRIFH